MPRSPTSTPFEGLHGVVLAAGLSRRMGAFKPLLEIAGRTVLAWAVGTLRDGGIDGVTVVVGHRADELRPEVARLGAAAVLNPDYEQGMYTSVRAGAAALPRACDAFFLLPCDIPAAGSRTVRLLAEARAAGGDAAATIPSHGGRRGHPPLISTRLVPEILGDEPPEGLRSILQRHAGDVRTVDVAEPGVLLDLDRPGDVPGIEALLRGR
jgi:molybdenum cofactor cytidylyltransferase